jgi:hypothetical protein
MNVIGYKLLRASSPEVLEQQVLEALRTGWALQGGVAFGGGTLMQAVVRIAVEPKTQSQTI